MAVNFTNPGQFTIGPDNSITVIDVGTGNEIDFGDATMINFMSAPKNQRTPVDLMSGVSQDLVFDKGWHGDFSIQRTNANADVYWSNLEALVRSGVSRPLFNIIQNIRESNGTITQNTFLFCQVTYDEAGTWSNDQGVVQKFSYTAYARESVNNSQ